MSKKPDSLLLEDLQAGDKIDIVDHMRGHGIHAEVTRIVTAGGTTKIEFVDNRSIRYSWSASAMGLLEGVCSFWTTYRRRQAPGNVRFDLLYSSQSA